VTNSKRIVSEVWISLSNFARLEKKFNGISSAKELVKIKELESENNRLKKMFANLSLEHEALKDVMSKKW